MRLPYMLRYAIDHEPATLTKLTIGLVQIVVLSVLWYMDASP